ncbi:MAG TPA: hypothetical protein VGO43_11295 [Pyrinomonadaceae bacterium]|jgi:hypothetical protein|nr:hypothetical protein [Pyrinomonadaceae bacterium]
MRHFIALLLFGLVLANCQTPSERINRMGPDERADLLIVFKKGTSAEEILNFDRTVTGIPNEHSSGYADLPAIMTGAGVQVNGYDGVAINYKPDATLAEKELIERRVHESPIVLRAYSGVVPNGIHDLP